MEPQRFDALARSLSRRFSRRGLLAAGSAGGLALFADAPQATAADQCTFDFTAAIAEGPSIASGDATLFGGRLELTYDDRGAIGGSAILQSDGSRQEVIGQWSGPSLSLRIFLGGDDRNALVAIGVGRGGIEACSSAFSGSLTGPRFGDIGSWEAAPAASGSVTQTVVIPGTSGVVETVTAEPPPLPPEVPEVTPTPCTTTCAAGFTPDPDSCECVCSDPNVLCGSVCCPDPIGCDDGGQNCRCPANATWCGGACVGCDGGHAFDPSTCMCLDSCVSELTLCDGACVDTATDFRNCGACGNACVSGASCFNGSCRCSDPGRALCSDRCADISNEATNCGGCGTRCFAGLDCQFGVCCHPSGADCSDGAPCCNFGTCAPQSNGTSICLN